MTGRGMGYCVLNISEGDPLPPAFGQNVLARSEQETDTFKETGKEGMTMPAGNGTGPLGFGPMTGRAAGYCAGYPVPGYMNPVAGRGGYYGQVGPAYAAGPYAPVAAPYGYGYPVGRGFFGRGFGRGRGRGFGRGFGRGRGRFAYGW